MNLQNIFNRLESRDVVVPLLEDAITSGNWPDSYTVTIDSAPYYGLTDVDGKGGKGGSGDGFFHPSTHPFWGERRLFLAFHPKYQGEAIHQARTVTGEMTLSMGSALHGVIQAQFEMAGVLRPENVEYEYINEEHHCRGRIDFILDMPNGTTLPVELKTMNSYSFKNLEVIKDSWDAQLSMALDNSGHDTGVLLVMEAGWPYTMREFKVNRNDELLSRTYEKFDRVRDALEDDVMPAPCCAPESAEMKECPWRYFCWSAEGES